MENIKTSQQHGTKWFTFYTKIRPWFACLMLLPSLVDFFEYANTYFSLWWMLLSFIFSVAHCVLTVLVFIKSNGDYVEFVRFVKGVLLFETVVLAYHQSVQQYISTSFNFGLALLQFLIFFVLGFFLWYRLNIKYFVKRIPAGVQRPLSNILDSKNIDAYYCTHCGAAYIKGNHDSPNNSMFCQHCGNKIELTEEAETSSIAEFENTSSEDALKTIFKIHAQETIKAMDVNSLSQPNNEGDADFGLVPEKPIFTLALKSVEGEKEYLEKLYTINGEKIQYRRRCSTGIDNINGLIDIYDTYLPSGEPYKTIYINMYGAQTSNCAPKGFMLCNASKKAITSCRTGSASKKPFSAASIISVVLSVISILCVVAAMNLQDMDRNIYEAISPTLLYLVLIGIHLVSILLFFFSKSLRFPIAQHLFTFIPTLFAIITSVEGSLFSDTYDSYLSLFYINYDLVNICNILWVSVSLIVLAVNIVPFATNTKSRWRSSLKYREKCYKRISKLKEHLDSGIITEEEFKRDKEDILKTIQP